MDQLDLATSDMNIPQDALGLESAVNSAFPARAEQNIPAYYPKGKTAKLLKNEDPENEQPFIGATFEVLQYNLWVDDERKAYQDKLTEVATDPLASIYYQNRMEVPEKNSMTVILEISHRVLVSNNKAE